jgi:hypothetical protein
MRHGSWVKYVLSSPLWFPVASLSYCAFLFQLAACYWAIEVIVASIMPAFLISRALSLCLSLCSFFISSHFYFRIRLSVSQVLANGYGHDIKTGYLYFSKAYFMTLAFALVMAIPITALIEKPILKLSEMRNA